MTERRHPGGRTCQLQAMLLVVLFPIAIPFCVARSAWLRKQGRIK